MDADMFVVGMTYQESDELAEEQINDLKRTLGEIQVVDGLGSRV
jgi:hypothetical protein